MSETRSRCVLVGDESLTIQCGEILRERGHAIVAVVTAASDVKAWADEHSLPLVEPATKGLSERLPRDVDWLFSAGNLRVLTDDVIALPRRHAINFHDGPLPRYGGLYATSWALMAREKQHGITWHVIEGGVDEGRIAVQRVFDVAEDETAVSLNTRCYLAGIETFRELVASIEGGTFAPVAQDLSHRTYFGRYERPAAMGAIDWTRSAEEIAALVRALDFGKYANPLSCAKCSLNGRVFLVLDARVATVPQGVTATPGAISSACAEEATVLCGDGALRLLRIADADGSPLGTDVLSRGAKLDTSSPEERARLDAAHRAVVKSEAFWGKRLAAPALELAHGVVPSSAPRMASTDIALPDTLSADGRIAALALALLRVSGADEARIGYTNSEIAALAQRAPGYLASAVPLIVSMGPGSAGDRMDELGRELARLREKQTFLRDLRARRPGVARERDLVVLADVREGEIDCDAPVTFYLGAAGAVRVRWDQERIPVVAMRLWCGRLEALAHAVASAPHADPRALPTLGEAERHRVVVEFNRTTEPHRASCIHALFEAQVDRTPDAVAVTEADRSLTYRELDGLANALAAKLIARGVVPDQPVIHSTARSLDMVVAMIGVLKAGGAYVPLDPDYPADRLALMREDSGARIVVTQRALAERFAGAELVFADQLSPVSARPTSAVRPEHLAYVLYTSGSTGRPKGVMVEHRNVVAFFHGMDARVPRTGVASPGTWLAVTSLSFDISVLELLYTLTRGFHVVVHRDRRGEEGGSSLEPQGSVDFGLCYWGNDDQPGRGKYELLLEGAKFADTHGFTSVWTPERHFHAFGGPFPNPSVSGAAVAAITRNLHVRAASVVLPLHHPVRVAEEWAMIDNLSDGRVGLGIAAGWQPDDFVLRPENTPPAAKDAMFRDIEVLRRLWRGEEVAFPRKDGSMHGVVSQPRPVQKELPIWLTIALNPESYRQAADVGAHVLTHLLGQSIDELATKIRIYRDRLVELGKDPASGKVTLMLHTFVARDREEAREITREPLKRYLASAASLIKQYVWMFPALKRPHGASAPENIDLASLDQEELDAILEYAFHRYFDESGLLGSVDDCVARVAQLRAIGVDEIGCLVDYGVEKKTVLAHLPYLAEVVAKTSRPRTASDDHSIPALINRHHVTHLQCTPSMARMLLMQDSARLALARVSHLLVGGEPLTGALVGELRKATRASIDNMYGPTETTIWSSSERVTHDPGAITVGRPIANTTMYVLDPHLMPLGIGEVGELWIGGAGVARGYWQREELTRERFLPDPFADAPGARMYRTGDLARWQEDGRLELLGRVDHQVKVRGYRIELGEIESAMMRHPSVREAVVLARQAPSGDAELVAYATPRVASGTLDVSAIRAHLSAILPPYMVPARFVTIAAFPLTPNKKIDRKALPSPESAGAADAPRDPTLDPANALEESIAAIWREVLGVSHVGREESFFDIGGHSLLAVRLHRRLGEVLPQRVPMTDVFRFPTVRSFAEHVGGNSEAEASKLDAVASRAAARRAAMMRRPQAAR